MVLTECMAGNIEPAEVSDKSKAKKPKHKNDNKSARGMCTALSLARFSGCDTDVRQATKMVRARAKK